MNLADAIVLLLSIIAASTALKAKLTQSEPQWFDLTGAPTASSSVDLGGVSSRAVASPNPSSKWGKGTCTHTEKESNPWWKVTLPGEIARVMKVRVLNRGNGYGYRLNNFSVTVIKTLALDPDRPKDKSEVCAKDVQIEDGESLEFDCKGIGNELMISINKTEFLTLCEVAVFGYSANSMVINVAGMSHKTWIRKGSDSEDEKGLWLPYKLDHRLALENYRPEWLTLQRCDGTACTSCTEGEDSCFFGRQSNFLAVHIPQSSPWRSAVFTWHIHCEAAHAHFMYEINSMVNGKLTVYWDSKKVKDLKEVVSQKVVDRDAPPVGQNISLLFSVETLGRPRGHLLQFVFDAPVAGLPTQGSGEGRHAFLSIARPRVLLNESSDILFAQCEDYKACLRVLGSEPYKNKGKKLRERNDLQYKCLTDAISPSNTGMHAKCVEWRECLGDDFEGHLLTLLRAAGHGSPVQSQNAFLLPAGRFKPAQYRKPTQTLVAVRPEVTKCIDPFISDPESWGCDCYEALAAECKKHNSNQPLEQCIQEKMCASERVCSSWQATHCDETSMSQLQKRAVFQEESGALDDSLASKSCQ